MKNNKISMFLRTVSGLLAFLTVFTLMATLSLVPAFAADEEEENERLFADIYNDYYTDPNYDPMEDLGVKNPDFTLAIKRVNSMEKMSTSSDERFELYVDKISGEVALKDRDTGDILFSNPYDIAEYSLGGQGAITRSVKAELLSQINISYNDNGQSNTYNSFEHAALLGQITVKKLRGGVRVEYSIGEEATRTLVPRRMSEQRYQEMIYSQLMANIPRPEGQDLSPEDPTLLRVTSFFEVAEINKNASDEYQKSQLEQFPALKKYDKIRYFTGENYREIKQTERYIKMYCPKYTFEELDKDHAEMGYTEKDKAPANFRIALEYYLDDFGVKVRVPTNGLSFDEASYELNSISILPYMGAGYGAYKGYTLIPDGSGALMRFEDVEGFSTVTGNVYGDDYSYQEISGENEEVFRMPVFGVVTYDEKIDESTPLAYTYKYEYKKDPDTGEYIKDALGNNIIDPDKTRPLKPKREATRASGYVAIITNGDALASITSLNGGGSRHPFNTAYCSFNPRPKDAYNLADAISVGGDGKVSVVSDRKYTGLFEINYIMLTDVNDSKINLNPNRTYYDTSYVGMAKAYRDYLENQGTISKLTDEDVKDDIPLYIEAFGVTETEESFVSIPVTVKKPLTTFAQLEQMIDECQAAGISNIGMKLTGYVNGGLYSTVPTKVNFEKCIGGNDGYAKFLKTAKEKGVAVYPEFDFAYMSATEAFDGFKYSRDAIKTIDNRYITKREYSAVLQTFSTTGKICISPCVYRDYFESFDESFKKILGKEVTNVSLGSLGSDLNSDFDDDDPYNREDAKVFTLELLKSFDISASYGDIMISGGNAYAMQYADVVLNAPLDSSRYAYASEAVPFFGMVYHGYVVFAGGPTNMAGDIKYETLKILENGATLYMMLSYDNVELLKEDEYFSKYYAVNYEIWKKTLFDTKDEAGNVSALGLYSKLNNALKTVQTSAIDNHGFIDCMRTFTDLEFSNVRYDAKEYHRDGMWTTKNDRLVLKYMGLTAAKAEYHNYLNMVELYRERVKAHKDALMAYKIDHDNDPNTADVNIYDSSAELLAIAQNPADPKYGMDYYNEAMSYSSDDVVLNAIILEYIVDYYKKYDTTKMNKYSQMLVEYQDTLSELYDENQLNLGDIQSICNSMIDAEEEYLKYLTAYETYMHYIDKNVIALKSAGVYDNSEELRALVDADANDAYDNDFYQAATAYSTDDVAVNVFVLKALVQYYTEQGDTAKADEYTEKLARYNKILFEIGDTTSIVKLVEDINTGKAADSEMLTQIMSELRAQYDANRVVNDGSVVFVKYENGQYFVLNYNSFTIEITRADLIAAGVSEADAATFPDRIEVAAKDFYVKGGNV